MLGVQRKEMRAKRKTETFESLMEKRKIAVGKLKQIRLSMAESKKETEGAAAFKTYTVPFNESR